MLLDYCQELEGHSTGLFAAGLPLLNSGFAGIEVSGKNRLADMCLLTNMFDLVGAKVDGTTKQDSSNWRIVVWSIAPTFCKAAAEAWMAAKASLLNFFFVVMANLR